MYLVQHGSKCKEVTYHKEDVYKTCSSCNGSINTTKDNLGWDKRYKVFKADISKQKLIKLEQDADIYMSPNTHYENFHISKAGNAWLKSNKISTRTLWRDFSDVRDWQGRGYNGRSVQFTITNKVPKAPRVKTNTEVDYTSSFHNRYVESSIFMVEVHETIELIAADGLFNVYAKQVEGITLPRGYRIYQATWIASGRTIDEPKLKSGYIARYQNTYFHIEKKGQLKQIDADQLIKRVERKFRNEQNTVRLHKKEQARRLLYTTTDIPVCLNDSIEAGNCVPGTLEFVETYRLNKERVYSSKELYKLSPHNRNLLMALRYAYHKYECMDTKQQQKAVKRISKIHG